MTCSTDYEYQISVLLSNWFILQKLPESRALESGRLHWEKSVQNQVEQKFSNKIMRKMNGMLHRSYN